MPGNSDEPCEILQDHEGKRRFFAEMIFQMGFNVALTLSFILLPLLLSLLELSRRVVALVRLGRARLQDLQFDQITSAEQTAPWKGQQERGSVPGKCDSPTDTPKPVQYRAKSVCVRLIENLAYQTS